MAVSGCKQTAISTPIAVTSTTTPVFAALPSSTATESPKPAITETPWPTLVYYFYPSLTPDPKRTPPTPQPTITAPPSRNPPLVLPDGLKLEEYKITEKDVDVIESPVEARHPNRGGWYYWPKGGMIDGKLFQAQEKIIDHRYAEIHATLDNNEIFVVECGFATPLPTVITAWVYGNHWIIQSVCHQEFDIFWDGESLNTNRGYQSSFAFQILGQLPFYLFKKNGQVWLSYNGSEVLLGYDEVKLTYCCMSYHPPQHYENMITFYASKGDQLYYVAIGLFEK
jgi:hypothetical protein